MRKETNVHMPPPEQRRSLFEAAANEAHAYKWIESEKAQRDLGDKAIADWHKKFWWSFCRQRFIEHLMGEFFWEELDIDDYAMLNYCFDKDDTLISMIVDIFRNGGENLNVVTYAIENGLDMDEVEARLQVIDINSRRLSPAVAITEKQFVDNIHANHHPRGMVVDVDSGVCEMLRSWIEKCDMECIVLGSAEEAMVEAQARQFDVFFIELHLPKKQGTEVAWFLRRHGVVAPVVAMSANLEIWSDDDLRDCGFSDIISKPIDSKSLTKVLQATGQGRKTINP